MIEEDYFKHTKIAQYKDIIFTDTKKALITFNKPSLILKSSKK